MQNLLASYGRLVCKERGIANKHLKQYDADGPPVDSLIVALLAKHLRRNVVRCSDRAVCKFAAPSVSKLFL